MEDAFPDPVAPAAVMDEPAVPDKVARRGEKRKRQEDRDEYESDDELEIFRIQDAGPAGKLKNVFDCLWSQARQVGMEEASRVAADLFNETVYKYDSAAGTQLAPHRARLLSKPMTPSAMLRLAEELMHTRDGAETAISAKMRTLWDFMGHLEENGLWRRADPFEPAYMSEREAKQYFKLMEAWLKLKKERDVEFKKRDKLEYEKATVKVTMRPAHFRTYGFD